MKTTNRSNALLVELLIVVLFFMLASTVLLQVFAAARGQGAKAEILSVATGSAQDVAETLYAAQEPEAALTAMGFTQSADAWLREADGYVMEVRLREEEAGVGILHRRDVRVMRGEEELLTIPCARYEEVRP